MLLAELTGLLPLLVASTAEVESASGIDCSFPSPFVVLLVLLLLLLPRRPDEDDDDGGGGSSGVEVDEDICTDQLGIFPSMVCCYQIKIESNRIKFQSIQYIHVNACTVTV